ncbi:hypothetical protein HAZT_HAZT005237 [Hyalella azteca]|uniref:Beta-hexosaminidase n=1 Tax=Hyalella azteca TaxID=294128 RepID=A0A6A0H661_HYAAZ|nr:hypothetical protein HAZT_HAZT005237 [Hyalella azteca]
MSRFIPINVMYGDISSHSTQIQDFIKENWEAFKGNLEMIHPDYVTNGVGEWTTSDTYNKFKVYVNFIIKTGVSTISRTTIESYSLNISSTAERSTVTIEAITYFGARHGLETFSQLLNYDAENNCLQMINSLGRIYDEPFFRHRGLSLDTSRNYIPVKSIKKTIDAMAANKLNYFHWHITDTHSFPFKMESWPQMHEYGAYSPRQVYSHKDVSEIVRYGNVRGVKVYPELDSPAHIGNGWQWGPTQELGTLAVCVNQSYCVEPPCGQLNIANPRIYDVLASVYKELADAFSPVQYFHFGGDEVSIDCWNSSAEIRDWMSAKYDNVTKDSYFDEWANFHSRSMEIFENVTGITDVKGESKMWDKKGVTGVKGRVKGVGQKGEYWRQSWFKGEEKMELLASKMGHGGILWTSSLTEAGMAAKYLDPEKFIIQIWTYQNNNDSLGDVEDIASKGFELIITNADAWYLDCGVGAWVGNGFNWCSPYKPWQTVYDNNPLLMVSPEYRDKIIGGEAALWTEQADAQTLDSKLWPRGAALAERLWSNPNGTWADAELRMILHRQRLVERGIAAERLQPQWCFENEGLCYIL